MSSDLPHYLLFAEAKWRPRRPGHLPGGRWRFLLQPVDREADLDNTLEGSGREEELTANRLELLAVVRGLEALDQPSHVTLVTTSGYVMRGLRFGLENWRENDWKWERYGQMETIKNEDLWRRVDGALHYHRVRCRRWRFDRAHRPAAAVVGERVSSLSPVPPPHVRWDQPGPARPHRVRSRQGGSESWSGVRRFLERISLGRSAWGTSLATN